MIGSKEFLVETEGLHEGLLRSGAALAFAAQGKRYGDEAVEPIALLSSRLSAITGSLKGKRSMPLPPPLVIYWTV
jgi:hypothetical protein